MERNSRFPEIPVDAVPQAERRPILLRAYAEPSITEERSFKPSKEPEWVLIFDTETTSDESQQLRFGTYQLWEGEGLAAKGLFYGKVEPSELEALKIAARKHECELRSAADFTRKIFLAAAFKAGALVVGFNLPFDLSRLAIDHDVARVARAPRSKGDIEAGKPMNKADRFMVGGFTFRLSSFDNHPFLRVKHHNSRSAFFRFARPAHQEMTPSERRKGQKAKFQSGNFIDVKTLAAALTSTSHRLSSLAKYLGVTHKGDFKDFARPIDAEFIECRFPPRFDPGFPSRTDPA